MPEGMYVPPFLLQSFASASFTQRLTGTYPFGTGPVAAPGPRGQITRPLSFESLALPCEPARPGIVASLAKTRLIVPVALTATEPVDTAPRRNPIASAFATAAPPPGRRVTGTDIPVAA